MHRPIPTHEIALHSSLYAAPTGYTVIMLIQSRKAGHSHYYYRLIDLSTSEAFLPDDMAAAVFDGWFRNYTDVAMHRLGRCPVDYLYTNTLQYKRDIQSRFDQARKDGYGDVIFVPAEWQFCQVRRWRHVDGLAGDALQGALLTLAAAINNSQLLVEADIIQRLRDEIRADYDWEKGIKSMPLTLAAFVQAFSLLPLKRKMSAAQAYARKSFV